MKDRNIEHKDDWATPYILYSKLDEAYSFDFDPCPYSEGEPLFDGLVIDWGQSNFVNPPYSRKLKEQFVLKAIEQSNLGKLCVMLLPVSTSTKLFHEHILPNASSIQFVRSRISFEGVNTKGDRVGAGSKPMHDSMIVVFDGDIGSCKVSTFNQ